MWLVLEVRFGVRCSVGSDIVWFQLHRSMDVIVGWMVRIRDCEDVQGKIGTSEDFWCSEIELMWIWNSNETVKPDSIKIMFTLSHETLFLLKPSTEVEYVWCRRVRIGLPVDTMVKGFG